MSEHAIKAYSWSPSYHTKAVTIVSWIFSDALSRTNSSKCSCAATRLLNCPSITHLACVSNVLAFRSFVCAPAPRTAAPSWFLLRMSLSSPPPCPPPPRPPPLRSRVLNQSQTPEPPSPRTPSNRHNEDPHPNFPASLPPAARHLCALSPLSLFSLHLPPAYGSSCSS